MRAWAAVAVAALWASLAPLQMSIDLDRERYQLKQVGGFRTLEDLLLQAFSDFRIALSNFLWIRVDAYLHLYALREELEKKVEAKAEAKHEHEAGKPHRRHLTPEQQRARARMESEIMPLVRIVTWLDPHFVLAFQVGAWTLGDRLKKPAEAEEFLKEGIRNNPDRYELYSELGFTYFFYLKDYPKAAIAFGRALQLPIAHLNEKKKTIRMLAYCYEKSGEIEKAVTILEKYIQIDPKNGKARQRLERLKKQLAAPK